MKEKYEKQSIQIIPFEPTDVVATSETDNIGTIPGGWMDNGGN